MSPHEITNITSNLSIEKMNAFIYQLENNKYDLQVLWKMKHIIKLKI